MRKVIKIIGAIALVALLAVSNVTAVLADDDEDSAPKIVEEIFQSGGGVEDVGRYGWASIYETWQINGWHYSSSDMTEDYIKVKGGIQEIGQGWYQILEQERNDYFMALVETVMPDPAGEQDFHTQSEHWFHTDGYGDSHGFSDGWMYGT